MANEMCKARVCKFKCQLEIVWSAGLFDKKSSLQSMVRVLLEILFVNWSNDYAAVYYLAIGSFSLS